MSDLELVVLLKQVPDIDEVKFDKEEGRIDRSSAETITNPFDLNALEEAVRIKEEVGGKITVLSMGPPQTESTIRDGLARGADEGILLTDPQFGGADTWATSYTLACGIKKLDGFDLILCGEKTIDGDTGQVGAEVAEVLDVPHVAYVDEVLECGEDGLKVSSEAWDCTYVRRLEFPGLITVTKDLNEPSLPSLNDKMSAKKAEIEEWDADDLADVADEKHFGFQGSPTSVDEIEVPEKEVRECEKFSCEPDEAAEKIFSLLKEMEVVG